MKPSRFPALVSELVLPRFGSSTLGLQCGGFNSDSRGLHTAASIRTDSSPPGCPADPIHPPAMPASQLPGWKSLPTSLAPHATGKDWSQQTSFVGGKARCNFRCHDSCVAAMPRGARHLHLQGWPSSGRRRCRSAPLFSWPSFFTREHACGLNAVQLLLVQGTVHSLKR